LLKEIRISCLDGVIYAPSLFTKIYEFSELHDIDFYPS
jgi:hypothetical protein